MYDDDEDEGNSVSTPQSEMEEWVDQNKWFQRDPVLKAAAIEIDNTLHGQGIVPGRKRLNMVEDNLRRTYSERFYDTPKRESKWGDVSDPGERREAKRALKEINEGFRVSVRKQLSEARYLKDYLGG